MQLQVKCKGSQSFEDQFAFKLAGGYCPNPESDRPTFIFQNDPHYQEYRQYRRKLKRGESIESIARSYQVSGGASGVPETPAETRKY